MSFGYCVAYVHFSNTFGVMCQPSVKYRDHAEVIARRRCVLLPNYVGHLLCPRARGHFGIARSVHLFVRPSVCPKAQLPRL